ncbi:hypothetical protein D3C73_1571860 [compost metagenome]
MRCLLATSARATSAVIRARTAQDIAHWKFIGSGVHVCQRATCDGAPLASLFSAGYSARAEQMPSVDPIDSRQGFHFTELS